RTCVHAAHECDLRSVRRPAWVPIRSCRQLGGCTSYQIRHDQSRTLARNAGPPLGDESAAIWRPFRVPEADTHRLLGRLIEMDDREACITVIYAQGDPPAVRGPRRRPDWILLAIDLTLAAAVRSDDPDSFVTNEGDLATVWRP